MQDPALIAFLFTMVLPPMSVAGNFILEILVADLAFGCLIIMDKSSVLVEMNLILENLVTDLALGFCIIMD